VVFDVELLAYDYRNAPSQIFLREVGAGRRLDLVSGAFEVAALGWELDARPSIRPRTHHAMRAILTALGGELAFVRLDKFHHEGRIYEAKLHIQQRGLDLCVDVRPSDAITLAQVCGVPILVAHELL